MHLSKLQRLRFRIPQRDLITDTPRYGHINPVLLALHWLLVKFRICYKIAAISFKAIHNLGPAYLSNLINIKRVLAIACGVMWALFCKTLSLSSNALLGTDHLLQMLQRYGTVYRTILGKSMILDMFKRLIKTNYFKEA